MVPPRRRCTVGLSRACTLAICTSKRIIKHTRTRKISLRILPTTASRLARHSPFPPMKNRDTQATGQLATDLLVQHAFVSLCSKQSVSQQLLRSHQGSLIFYGLDDLRLTLPLLATQDDARSTRPALRIRPLQLECLKMSAYTETRETVDSTWKNAHDDNTALLIPFWGSEDRWQTLNDILRHCNAPFICDAYHCAGQRSIGVKVCGRKQFSNPLCAGILASYLQATHSAIGWLPSCCISFLVVLSILLEMLRSPAPSPLRLSINSYFHAPDAKCVSAGLLYSPLVFRD